MSILSLKNQISAFFEQPLDSIRQRLDSNCLIENPTAARLTEALDSLDSLDSNLEARGSSKKPCNTCNSVQEISESELIYPQYTNIAANDQETLKETDPDFYEFLYGKSTEELLYNHLLTCNQCEHLALTGTNQHKVSTRLELINNGTITARIENNPIKKESYSPLEDGQLKRKSADNSPPKIYGDALKTEPTPQVEEASTVERKTSLYLDNYSHCVTCNQCENLALTGSCSRLGKRVNPQALRECDSFQLLKTKQRPPLEEVKPYTQDELNRLLNQAAKPLYHHLIDCQQCSLEDTRYCVEGFGLGNTFDCLLLCFDDAADKRYKLMNQVIKARVSGRRLFESLFSDNALLPRQDAVKTHQWGNTPEYEAFINHWTACKVCKPNLGRYCSEGQRLEKEANC